jgi:hypothetical protein
LRIAARLWRSAFSLSDRPDPLQWRFNGANVDDATNATLTLVDVQPEDSGNYSVVVSDDNNSLTSADATLSVLSPPTIVQQPQSRTAVAYTDVFFSVLAGGEGPFTYRWRFNGMLIAGGTNSVLALPNVQPNQAGNYSVEVFNPVASVMSSNAVLTLLLPASIVQQPQSTNVAPGANVTFTVVATSSTPITYQWRFNDVDIPGATSSSLTVNAVQEEDAGNYVVVVTDGIGSVSSQVAVLGVTIPLSFVQVPLSQTAVEGGSVTFSTEIRGGPPPFGYEWRLGSAPLISNTLFALKGFFTITNLQTSHAGGYRVVVKNITNPNPGIGNAALAQLTVLRDFDRDGVPDVIEQALGMNTNNTADGAMDLDGDGVSNRDEFTAGTDPQDPASYLWVDGGQASGITTIWFPAMSNKTYTVEFCDDLNVSAWLKLDDIVARSTNHLRVLTDPNPTASRFYRVVTPRRP